MEGCEIYKYAEHMEKLAVKLMEKQFNQHFIQLAGDSSLKKRKMRIKQ